MESIIRTTRMSSAIHCYQLYLTRETPSRVCTSTLDISQPWIYRCSVTHLGTFDITVINCMYYCDIIYHNHWLQTSGSPPGGSGGEARIQCNWIRSDHDVINRCMLIQAKHSPDRSQYENAWNATRPTDLSLPPRLHDCTTSLFPYINQCSPQACPRELDWYVPFLMPSSSLELPKLPKLSDRRMPGLGWKRDATNTRGSRGSFHCYQRNTGNSTPHLNTLFQQYCNHFLLAMPT